jgi:cell division protein FtsB
MNCRSHLEKPIGLPLHYFSDFHPSQTAAEREVYQQRMAELLKENELLRDKVSELEASNKRLRQGSDLIVHNKFD